MITIWFETHCTTTDNEKKISSGWNNSQLSEVGLEQAKQLGARWKSKPYDLVFSSDLDRAWKSATIAFGIDTRKVLSDWRLRECDYGDFTQKPSTQVEAQKVQRINQPFPGGESYQDCLHRMESFIEDLKNKYGGKTVVVIGHRATQYSLENIINRVGLKQAIEAEWKWQPGWEYKLM